MPKRPIDTPEAQSERFIAMAKELGADKSEERFNEKLKNVAVAKVVDRAPQKPPSVKVNS